MSVLPEGSVILSGANEVERFRALLNSLSSVAPPRVAPVIAAALDQVADQQVAISKALTALASGGDLTTAENQITTAITEARRATLRGCRELADGENDLASSATESAIAAPEKFTDLLTAKREVDEAFRNAVKQHDGDNPDALELLPQVAEQLRTWRGNVLERVDATTPSVRLDRWRLRLQYIGLALAILALLIGLLNFFGINFTKLR